MAEGGPGAKIFDKPPKQDRGEKHKDWKKSKKEGTDTQWGDLLTFGAVSIFEEMFRQIFG